MKTKLMSKTFMGILVGVMLLGTLLFQVVHISAQTNGNLDHVSINPLTASLAVGATQQYSAQGYDANNVAIPNLTYTWTVIAGGGSVSTSGLFTAGAAAATYTNTVEVIAFQGSTAQAAFASVSIFGTVGTLDHVQLTPAHANVSVGATQPFTAQAYDSNNVAIPGLTYNWSVVAGGGAISTAGLFTAGSTAGSYTNTVQVQAVQGSNNNRVAFASVNVTSGTTSPSALNTKKLVSLLNASLKTVGFDNLLSAQLVVKQGTANVTVNVIPGQVTVVAGTSLTLMPNGQTTPITYNLPSASVVQPSGTQLAVNDKVVVVTLNDQVSIVYKVTAPAAPKSLPPGLEKKGDSNGSNNNNKVIPPGWSKGNKTGWNNDQANKTNNSANKDN